MSVYTGCDRTPWRVDIEMDRFLWIVGFQEEELGDYGGGDGFIDFAIQADDPFLSIVSMTGKLNGLLLQGSATFSNLEKMSSCDDISSDWFPLKTFSADIKGSYMYASHLPTRLVMLICMCVRPDLLLSR